MPEKLLGYYNFNFTRSKRTGLSLRLALEETVDVGKNSSRITYRFEYQNTGEAFTEDWQAVITIDGTTRTYNYRNIFAKTGDAWAVPGASYNYISHTDIPHAANGSGSYSIAAEFKTDPITLEYFSQTKYYRTVASVTATVALTPIDQSLPTITAAAVTADRYGGNAVLALACSHPSYGMTASLTIEGMTREQAFARNGLSYSATGAAVRSYYRGRDGGSHKVEYVLTITGSSFDGTVPLYYAGDSPLDSGRSYPYTLTVTAANSKSVTYNGVLAVPQKVTGIAFDDEALTLAVGESATPEYNISPGSAEVKAVSFESSDGDIATVSADGEITALSEGGCTVTVTSADHGRDGTDNYTAVIQISVVADSDGFPQLSAMDYLGVVEISRLSTACTWLADKLGKTAEMQDVVCQGRAHPVTDIRTIMEALEANVAALSNRPAAEITKHNDNWYGLVNGWVNSLNELYELNKEG